jgi:DNA-directed RNA polymerase subunit H (RpoH/RPB5)
MSKTEVSELTSEMGLMVTNLPKILLTDPQVQKLEAKLGDVLEINRDDFGRKYKHYRLVVED